MSDRTGLISAILNNLADDTPRLVFADFLQETGEGDRAEFIRAQIAAAQDPKGDASKPGKRAAAILKEYGAAWREALDILPHAADYHRGFLTEVWLYNDQFVDRAAALLAAEPMTFVLGLSGSADGVTEVPLPSVGRLAANPHLKAVTRIHSQTGDWGPKRFVRLLKSPYLGNLKRVEFFEDEIGLAGVKAIAESPSGFALTGLDLNESLQSQDDDERASTVRAVKLIATSPRFASLKQLGLMFNGLGERSAKALLASKTLPKSLHLEISDNPCEDEFAERLAERFTGGSDGGEEDD